MITAKTIANNINLNNDVCAEVILSMVDVETTSLDSEGGFIILSWFNECARKVWEGLDIHGRRAVEYKLDGVTVMIHESRRFPDVVWG